jgi:WD40 repeat protein
VHPSSALTALRRDKVAPEALAALGDGDPKRAPPGLVAVLGEAGPVHTGLTRRIAFSPDGRWLASASWDTTIILWEAATGRARRVLRGHTGEVTGVAYSKDGQTLVSASTDGTVKLWPTDKQEAAQTLPTGLGQLWSLAVSPDGRFVAVGSKGGTIRLWKWGQWDGPTDLATGTGWILALAFSPDGETLASGWLEEPDKGTIRLYTTASGKLTHTLPAHGAAVNMLAVSRDGKRLASVGRDNKLRVWDLATGKPVAEFRHDLWPGYSTIGGQPQPWWQAEALAFHPDGKKLAVAVYFQVAIFDLDSHRPEAGTESLRGHDGINCLAFSPDGKTLALGDAVGGVLFYETARWQPLPGLLERGHCEPVTAVAFSPDGRSVLSAGLDQTLRRWDLERPGKNRIVHRYQPAPEYRVAYSPDGKSFVTWTHWHWVETPIVWDAATGSKRFTFRQRAGACVYSPDGQSLAGVGPDGVVRLWDAADGKELHQFGHVGLAGQLAFSPDGKLLAVATQSTKLVKVWNVETGAEIHSWEDTPMDAVAFSPDGRLLVTGHEDGAMTLWDLAKKARVRTLRGHAGPVKMQLTPDGKTLVSWSSDGTVRLWDPERERARQVMRLGPPGRSLVCDLDPSGKYLVVGGHNQVISVLRLAP